MNLASIRAVFTCALLACTLAGAQAPKNVSPAGGVNPTNIPTSTGGAALSGKFVLDDGTAPPDRVRVELVCNSMPRPQGFSDDKGNFTIQLGISNLDPLSDLTYGTPNSRAAGGAGSITAPSDMDTLPKDLTGCELRGALPGFRSGVTPLTAHRRLDSSDVGTIVLHRLSNVQGLTVSATTTMAPEAARKSYEKGLDALKKHNPDDAAKEFRKAVDAYPSYAAAWYQLGRVNEAKSRWKDAADAYRKSIAADGKYLYPYERLYLVTAHDELWPEVRDVTAKTIALDPVDYPNAYYFSALANLNLNDMDAGEKSAREAVRLSLATNPRAGYVLGVILARKGNLPEALQLIRGYLQAVPNSVEVDMVKQQVVALEKMTTGK